MQTATNPDVEVVCLGSISQFVSHTQEGKDWIEDNLDTEGWQWMGERLSVDSRFVLNIVEGMLDDGLEVKMPEA